MAENIFLVVGGPSRSYQGSLHFTHGGHDPAMLDYVNWQAWRARIAQYVRVRMGHATG